MYTYSSSRSEELLGHTLVFNVEETLLRSSSWFPFFMLVALEGEGLLRGFLLLVLYPLLCLVDEDWKLTIMVFVSFFGVKTSTLRIGRTVLPKFFLEDVGCQGFEVAMRFGKRVAVSNFPRVMVEVFLQEYLGTEQVIGRELKVFKGYYFGLMESKEDFTRRLLSRIDNVIVLYGYEKTFEDQQIYTNCKDFYWVRQADKDNWTNLPSDKHLKPLIFHDGRLAFSPTPMASLAMFVWLPFGIVLCITKIIVTKFLPSKIVLPILAFLGTSCAVSKHDFQTNSSTNQKSNSKVTGTDTDTGIIYVCNHKTLLETIYISLACGVPLTALAYSISKLSQALSPIKTVMLTRDKETDAEVMQKTLSKGSIVLCPEGTTCREPHLLRFSPLFAEMTDDIVPVALETKVNMFYGTTATGIKALDPIFFLLNPYSYYVINILANLPKSHTCGRGDMSKFDVANYVQAEISKVLGYKCTALTRKDKYMMLAGNTGT